MSKKKFNQTKVGAFLSKAAPGILDLAGDVLPDAGVLGLVKNLIHKDPVLPTEDKEKALKLLEQERIGLLKTLTTTVYVAYFGSRGAEKFKSISKK